MSANQAPYTCDPKTCKPPKCLCAQNNPPGGLTTQQVPQFVLVSWSIAFGAVPHSSILLQHH